MDKELKTLINFINNNKVSVYRDENNDIIVDGDIVVYDDIYTYLPVKIHILNGSIIWKGNTDGFKPGTLSSLINFPDIVNGDVRISKNNNLSSLKYCPKYIAGTLQCDYCNISDISDIATHIGGFLILSYNPIEDVSVLEHVYVGKNIELLHTNVMSVNDIQLKNDSSVIVYEQLYNNIY